MTHVTLTIEQELLQETYIALVDRRRALLAELSKVRVPSPAFATIIHRQLDRVSAAIDAIDPIANV
jgi:hypothetical protein